MRELAPKFDSLLEYPGILSFPTELFAISSARYSPLYQVPQLWDSWKTPKGHRERQASESSRRLGDLYTMKDVAACLSWRLEGGNCGCKSVRFSWLFFRRWKNESRVLSFTIPGLSNRSPVRSSERWTLTISALRTPEVIDYVCYFL